MIRPVTFVALLLAGSSGLYLYQTKHRSEVLDQRIEQTLRKVSVARDHIGLLRAEWALLNEPDRLGQLAAQHLSLQPLVPSRFVSVSDLDAHLPPLGPPDAPADGSAPEETAAAASSAPAAGAAAAPSAPVRTIDAASIQTPARPAATPSPAASHPEQVAAVHTPPHPHPARASAEHAASAQHENGHGPARVAANAAAPEPAIAAPSRPSMITPVLQAVVTPAMAAARAPAPAVVSALGGYGRSTLAPPVPVGSR